MFAKYLMVDPEDYRGNVKLIKADLESNDHVAFTAVDILTDDMIELTPAEKAEVVAEVGRVWLSERQEYARLIDLRADEVRHSYLQKGPSTVSEEYSQVLRAAEMWAEQGKPADAIPVEISVWADVSGKGIEWAFNNIIQEAAGFRMMLQAVRELRLRGKEAMRVLPASELKDTFDVFIEQIESLRAAVDY